eukprot:Gb_21929 [translate_table: standard]
MESQTCFDTQVCYTGLKTTLGHVRPLTNYGSEHTIQIQPKSSLLYVKQHITHLQQPYCLGHSRSSPTHQCQICYNDATFCENIPNVGELNHGISIKLPQARH